MRVTHVITRLIVGGAQENTIATVLGLAARPGLDVDLISGPTTGPEGSLEGAFAAHPGRLTCLPDLVRPVHPWHDARAWSALVRLFRQRRPDIVHTHSGKAGFVGRLAARRAGVRLICHTIHGPSFGPFQGALTNALFRAAERWAGACTTHFVSVAQAMTRQYLAAGIGRPAQFSCIHSGFVLRPYLEVGAQPELRRRLGLAPDGVVVGKIARLFRLKGHDDLFAVAPALAAQCPRIKFLLVGDGAWRGRFERQAQALGMRDRFVFAGLVPPESVPSYLGVMDVLVHLSLREGLPRALPQALAAGRPVIAYDCDGAGEVCADGETGFLIAPRDRATLTRRILRLAADAPLRDRLGACGRRRVAAQFGLPTMLDALEQLYRRLWAQRPAA